MPLSKQTVRTYMIIKALRDIHRPSIDDIAGFAKLPRATTNRYLRALREEYGVNIQYISGEPTGHYRVLNWGGINVDAFIEHCETHSKESLIHLLKDEAKTC